jgi:hypothetical protein
MIKKYRDVGFYMSWLLKLKTSGASLKCNRWQDDGDNQTKPHGEFVVNPRWRLARLV